MASLSLSIGGDAENSAPRDQLVRQQARQLLCSSGYKALHNLECAVQAGVLELRGTVGSYYLKQLAQSLVRRSQAVNVINSIEVASVPERPEKAGSGSLSYVS